MTLPEICLSYYPHKLRDLVSPVCGLLIVEIQETSVNSYIAVVLYSVCKHSLRTVVG